MIYWKIAVKVFVTEDHAGRSCCFKNRQRQLLPLRDEDVMREKR